MTLGFELWTLNLYFPHVTHPVHHAAARHGRARFQAAGRRWENRRARGLAQLARDYLPRGVALVGINANDAANYPEDSPARMKEEVKSAGYLFPYLYDETQTVARAYRAACTPDVYLFDKNRKLVYRGQFDDSRPGNGIPVTGKDLRAALDSVLAGQPVASDQKPGIGCNIKWKAGSEPDYF
jgi:hypothetical protein